MEDQHSSSLVKSQGLVQLSSSVPFSYALSGLLLESPTFAMMQRTVRYKSAITKRPSLLTDSGQQKKTGQSQ